MVYIGMTNFMQKKLGWISLNWCHGLQKTSQGLISVPPIPVVFQSVLQILVEFLWNLPAKMSLLSQKCIIPVFTLEWSPESSHQNGPQSPVTGMTPESSDQNGAKKCQIQKVLDFHKKNGNKNRKK